MRPLSIFCIALLFVVPPALAQDSTPAPGVTPAPLVVNPVVVIEPGPAAAVPIGELQSYVVKLTEFRFKTPPARNLSSQEILDQFSNQDSDQFEQVESIALSALSGYESMAHFGKSTSVTTAVVNSPRPNRTPAPQDTLPTDRPDTPRPGPWQTGTVRHTQERTVGTILRVTANTQENLVLLKLEYEASRIVGEIPDDRAPDNQTVRYQSTLLIEPGKPTLLSGTTTKDNSYLVLQLEKK